jgi:transcriptional regulator with XRE-family HTH domain
VPRHAARRDEPWRSALREWRNQQSPRVTQAELARRVGVDSQTASRWETGQSQPRVEEADRLRRATGIVVYESEATLTERVADLERIVAGIVSELRGVDAGTPATQAGTSVLPGVGGVSAKALPILEHAERHQVSQVRPRRGGRPRTPD